MFVGMTFIIVHMKVYKESTEQTELSPIFVVAILPVIYWSIYIYKCRFKYVITLSHPNAN